MPVLAGAAVPALTIMTTPASDPDPHRYAREPDQFALAAAEIRHLLNYLPKRSPG
jgi:hypothetical protein